MKSVNRVTILGNLGNDPDQRGLPNGGLVTEISVATSKSWTDKQSGEKKERTEWHRVVFFARLAEVAAEYLRKGSQVYVEGELQTEKWTDKEGRDRYTTKIIARDLVMLGGKSGSAPAQRSEPAPAPRGFDDDLPF